MICANCGESFDRPPKSIRTTCSRSCQVALGWSRMSGESRSSRLETMSRVQTTRGSGRSLNELRWNRPGEREKSSESNRVRWADPTYKSRVSAAISDAHRTPEIREKLSQASVRRWRDPIYRANCLAAMIASHRSERHRRLMSEIRTAQWRDPEKRARYIAAIRRRMPQHSDFMRRRWASKRSLVVVRPPIPPVRPLPSKGYSMFDEPVRLPRAPTWRRIDLL